MARRGGVPFVNGAESIEDLEPVGKTMSGFFDRLGVRNAALRNSAA
jgi:hypothetical protein